MKQFAVVVLLFCGLYSFGQDTSRLFKFGLLPPTEEDLKQTPYSASFSLPPNYVLPPRKDLSAEMPFAGDQGCQGSCAGWATAYGLKSYQEKQEHHWAYNESTLFSPSFVYNFVKLNRMPPAIECSTGMTFREAFNVMLDRGAVPLSDMPYVKENCNGCLAPNPSGDPNLMKKALNFRLASWERLALSNPDEVKYYLTLGMPVVVGMVLDQSFVDEGYNAGRLGTKFIWDPHPLSASIGYHAMVCVGYDESLKEFKVLNSWSRSWGTDGYMYVPYNKFYQFLREAYIAYDALSPGLNTPALKPSEGTPVTATTGEFSSWFKVGYYREFDGLRVGLVYLSAQKDEIIVQFTDMANNKIIQSIKYSPGEEKSFFFKDKKVSLTFDKVDIAGRRKNVPGVYFTLKIQQSLSDPLIKGVMDMFRLDAANLGKSIRNLQQQQQQQQQFQQQLQQQQQL
jgi:hypothetical protein